MGESFVLFVDGPLAGNWRSLPDFLDTFQHLEVQFDMPAVYDSVAYLDEVIDMPKPLLYVITKVVIFDQWLRVAHAGDEKSRTEGLLTYLVPPEVRARLQPIEAS